MPKLGAEYFSNHNFVFLQVVPTGSSWKRLKNMLFYIKVILVFLKSHI